MQKKLMISTTPDYNAGPEPALDRPDRVREHTAPEINQRIDQETVDSISLYRHADHAVIARRLEKLDHEWDMERILETNASSLVLFGVLMGAFVNKWWLLLPFIVASFLLLHAIQGWCPPVPILRRRGVRTRREIDRERSALKLLRGDFDGFHSRETVDVRAVLNMLDQ